MSEILVNTIKKADGTGGLTVPTTAGDIVTTGGTTFTGAVAGTDLTLSGGVVFGDAGGSGTSTSNTLDSYEEGTWTPVYRTGSPTGTAITVTGGTQYSRYVKVGNLVQLNFGFANSTVSGSAGGLYISGFPFTLWSDGSPSLRTKGSSISYINGFNDSGDASLFVESSYALLLFQQATTWSLPTYTPTSGSYIHATVVVETST